MAPSLEESFNTSHLTTRYNDPTPHTMTNKQPTLEDPAKGDELAHTAEPVKQEHPETEYQHIWYITGPAGCGKSTVAQYIATALKLPFLEGDNFHPQANIDKMAKGHPLTDADRWDWLIALRTAATQTLANLPTHAPSPNAGSSPPASTKGSSDGCSDNEASSQTSSRSSSPTTSAFAAQSAHISSRSSNNGEETNDPSPLPAGVVLTCSALKAKYRDVLRIPSYNKPSIRIHFIYLSASESILLERVAARKGHYMGKEMVHSQVESLEVPGKEEWDVCTVEVGGAKEEVEKEVLGVVEGVVRGTLGGEKSGRGRN